MKRNRLTRERPAFTRAAMALLASSDLAVRRGRLPRRRRLDPDPGRVLRRTKRIVRRVKREIKRWIDELGPKSRRLDDRHRGQLEAMRYLATVIENAERFE